MDKSCQSSADTTTTSSSSSTTTATITSAANATNNREQYLKHLNKLSHKIAKPIIKKPPFDPNNHTQNLENNNNNSNNNDNNQPQSQPSSQSQPQVQQNLQQQQQQQPPVYNINKNDFRDVVQKLTGSPAHERFSTPPPIHAPKPPSSRLQRIRPPPLAHVSNRPPPLLNGAVPPPQPPPPGTSINPNIPLPSNFGHIGRPLAPLSPLPPFPTVHAAAESPVSAYMRILQNSISTVDSNPKQFSGFSPLGPLVSPRWNNFTSPQPHHHHHQQQQQHLPPPHQQQGIVPPSPTSAMIQSQSQLQFPMPSSPLPFGCLNSPRSQYPLLSPGLLFSPTSGQLGFPQLPLSPTVPVPSPRWRGF